MPTFHHVNLGVPPGLADAQGEFLTEILGYRRMSVTPELEALGALWYEADDGTQVHLSIDPEHQPAKRAHTAIEVGDDASAVEARLAAAGVELKVTGLGAVRVMLCQDPAGNRWELRSPA